MTVRYLAAIATNSSWGCFTKLLFKWRGSVYKLIWTEYLVFITLYYIISFVYQYSLTETQQKHFEKFARYCDAPTRPVEMSFVLGFFVTTIVRQWWHQYHLIPRPDSIALYINASIRENDEPTKLLKRTTLRYCNLSLALTFHTISPAFRHSYPKLQDFVRISLLRKNELETLEKLKSDTSYGIEWLPITWAADLLVDNKRNESKIMEELDKFRRSCTLLLDYENCSVPLVYIQVVTISVYTYFLLCLISRQWLIRDEDVDNLNLHFPFFTTLQFIFHMGWFKVAESIINPFGNDDDDFELDKMLKRNLEVTNLMMKAKENYSVPNIFQGSLKTQAFSELNDSQTIPYDSSLLLAEETDGEYLGFSETFSTKMY